MISNWQSVVPFFAEHKHEALLAQVAEMRQHATIFPAQENILRIFDMLDPDAVRIVILGQDPYHGAGQAHGLSFSVPEGVKIPPSLRNIFKEITTDVYEGEKQVFSNDLTRWATQGVFLLNATLTVEESKAGSHKDLGWQGLTDQVVKAISDSCQHVVFILWGAHAQKKKGVIDLTKHLVLESAHPSPLSAHNGFFGSRPFSKANAYLTEHGFDPIKW
jgi:uracil-DNA glycosylase